MQFYVEVLERLLEALEICAGRRNVPENCFLRISGNVELSECSLLCLAVFDGMSVFICRPFNASSKLFRHCREVHLVGQPRQITQQQRSK